IVLLLHIEFVQGFPVTQDLSCSAFHDAFGPYNHLVNNGERSFNMTTLTVQNSSVRIMELYIVMVKDFSILFSCAHLATTHTLGLNGIATLKPVEDIDVMDMLFRNVIATKPVEIIPVAHLILHFSLTWFTHLNPYR